jgi:hypothetical protein
MFLSMTSSLGGRQVLKCWITFFRWELVPEFSCSYKCERTSTFDENARIKALKRRLFFRPLHLTKHWRIQYRIVIVYLRIAPFERNFRPRGKIATAGCFLLIFPLEDGETEMKSGFIELHGYDPKTPKRVKTREETGKILILIHTSNISLSKNNFLFGRPFSSKADRWST